MGYLKYKILSYKPTQKWHVSCVVLENLTFTLAPLAPLTVISPALFCSKYVFKFFTMSFFVIMWSDGLMVKTLECGWKSCGFKSYFEHSSIKRNLKFRYSMAYMMSADDLVIMLTRIIFSMLNPKSMVATFWTLL